MKNEPKAIFIHGTASSGRIWTRLLEAIPLGGSEEAAPEGSMLTPDIPGMGDARLPEGTLLTFDDWLNYFRALGSGQRVHLVGHSLGGAIAIHLAQEPWVETVTLIAPATGAYCESRRTTSNSGRNPGSIVFESPLRELVAQPGCLSREDAKVLREDYAKAAPLLAAGVPWPEFSKSEAEYLHGRPVLLIYGEEDAIIPPCYFRRLGVELTAGKVCVKIAPLPGCGHIPQLERSAEVAHLIRSFWALENSVK